MNVSFCTSAESAVSALTFAAEDCEDFNFLRKHTCVTSIFFLVILFFTPSPEALSSSVCLTHSNIVHLCCLKKLPLYDRLP